MNMHLGVGIVIRNESGDLYFIQEKDETYPVEKFRNCYSLFGGKIEEGETPLDGLKRELIEEVDMSDLMDKLNIRFVQSFLIQDQFEFNLFEGILNDKDFDDLKNRQIFEGKSQILNRNSLIDSKWIWGLEEVIKFYLKSNL